MNWRRYVPSPAQALYLLAFSGCGLCVATGHYGTALVLENAGLLVVALTHKWVRA